MTIYNWRKYIRASTKDCEEIFREITDGSKIFIGTGAGEPAYLVDQLLPQVEKKGLHLIFGWSFREVPLLSSDYYPKPSYYFLTGKQRQSFLEGKADYIPGQPAQITESFKYDKAPDVVFIQVGVPDSHGYFSLGVSVDITRAAIEGAKLVVAQINQFMPRTHGDSFLHFRDIDYFVKHSEPVVEFEPPELPLKVAESIGRNISYLIPDKATIQMGIGPAPWNAVKQSFLKKDIGVHSFVISDWLMHLINEGVVTNRFKEVNRGKVVASFAIGTRMFYEFLDDSPVVEMKTAEYVSSSKIIRQHSRFISINTPQKLDLSGQVCAGHDERGFYSDIAGMDEFASVISKFPGGNSILAFSSVDKDGATNILPFFKDGEGIILKRNNIDYVVTEYGSINLAGKTLTQRALGLIHLAHPDFRKDLYNQVVNKIHFPVLSPVFLDYKPEIIYRHQLKTGENITIKQALPTDLEDIRRIFHSFTQREKMLRFFSSGQNIGKYLYKSFEKENFHILVAFIKIDGNEEAVGMAEFSKSGKEAQIAFAVKDSQRRRGIGRKLLAACLKLAQKEKIQTLKAQVLVQNRKMLNFFETDSNAWEKSEEGRIIQFSLDFPV
ncbi:MAG: GNAT family N-acetyltransferase [Myxococcota bacterium]